MKCLVYISKRAEQQDVDPMAGLAALRPRPPVPVVTKDCQAFRSYLALLPS